jgi:hypothetical protein
MLSPSLHRNAAKWFAVLLTAAVIAGVPLTGSQLQAQTSSNLDSRYWKLVGNSGTDSSVNFIGTTDNQPLIVKVNGRQVLRLEPTAETPNIIGGSSSNTVLSGQTAATIGGGGTAASPNAVNGSYATVSGGAGNTVGHQGTVGGGFGNSAGWGGTVAGGVDNKAAGDYVTVGGGLSNSASDSGNTIAGGGYNLATGAFTTVGGGASNTVSSFFTTVGGGELNRASAPDATVGGGRYNTARGDDATVGGGLSNSATASRATVGGGVANSAAGFAATVPGGQANMASADHSFAAGRRARAQHAGSFVWGDSTDSDVASTTSNQFIARASGGTTFYSNASLTAGVTLPPGGGSWSSLSDAAVKDNVTPVDPEKVLERVASLPVSTWNYESQNPSIRHIGPMAQDFREAFGVGEDDRFVGTVDADGVALAAIQGLNRKVEALQERLASERKGETTTADVWQAAALVILALGIGLAGWRVQTTVGSSAA